MAEKARHEDQAQRGSGPSPAPVPVPGHDTDENDERRKRGRRRRAGAGHGIGRSATGGRRRSGVGRRTHEPGDFVAQPDPEPAQRGVIGKLLINSAETDEVHREQAVGQLHSLADIERFVNGESRPREHAGMVASRVERDDNGAPRDEGDDGRPEPDARMTNDQVLMTKEIQTRNADTRSLIRAMRGWRVKSRAARRHLDDQMAYENAD